MTKHSYVLEHLRAVIADPTRRVTQEEVAEVLGASTAADVDAAMSEALTATLNSHKRTEALRRWVVRAPVLWGVSYQNWTDDSTAPVDLMTLGIAYDTAARLADGKVYDVAPHIRGYMVASDGACTVPVARLWANYPATAGWGGVGSAISRWFKAYRFAAYTNDVVTDEQATCRSPELKNILRSFLDNAPMLNSTSDRTQYAYSRLGALSRHYTTMSVEPARNSRDLVAAYTALTHLGHLIDMLTTDSLEYALAVSDAVLPADGTPLAQVILSHASCACMPSHYDKTT